MATILFPVSWGLVLMLLPIYELDLTIQHGIRYLNTLRDVVTLTFDLLTLESCHVMPRGCSIPVPSLNWI